MKIKSVISSSMKMSTHRKMKLSIFVLDNDVSFFEKTERLITSVLTNGQFSKYKFQSNIQHFTSPEECLVALNEKPSLLIFEFFLREVNAFRDGGMFMDKVLEDFPNQELLMTSEGLDSEMLFAQINKGLGNYVQKGDNISFRLATFINEAYEA